MVPSTLPVTGFEHLQIGRNAGVTTVMLHRPDVHNAFNAQLIEEITKAFLTLSTDPDTRVIVLGGEGPSFCAGADVNWMRDSIGFTRQQNVEDATHMAMMLESIAMCSKPVVCRVQGLAIGGGAGLACAADYVVVTTDSTFAFSEVKLGLVPAVISPYVLRRISAGQARALFVTGERFAAERALRIGLAHVAVPPDRLDAEIERVCGELLTAAPDAIEIAKHLVFDIAGQTPQEALGRTVETIATKRTDPEGQEGLSAFLEKRKPAWTATPAAE
jgi:methylglutaconyl-CoA hydratase